MSHGLGEEQFSLRVCHSARMPAARHVQSITHLRGHQLSCFFMFLCGYEGNTVRTVPVQSALQGVLYCSTVLHFSEQYRRATSKFVFAVGPLGCVSPRV